MIYCLYRIYLIRKFDLSYESFLSQCGNLLHILGVQIHRYCYIQIHKNIFYTISFLYFHIQLHQGTVQTPEIQSLISSCSFPPKSFIWIVFLTNHCHYSVPSISFSHAKKLQNCCDFLDFMLE